MTNYLYKNNFFEVRSKNNFFYLKYPGSMVAILGTYNDKLIMVRQYRGLIEENTFEVPAGSSEDTETLSQAAKREFFEETGIYVKEENRFIYKYPIILDPNRFIQKSYVFHIKLYKEELEMLRKKKTNEISKVLLLSNDEVLEMIKSNKISIGQTKEILLNHIFLGET